MENDKELIEKLNEIQKLLNKIGYINAFENDVKELNNAINRNTRELSILSKKIESIENNISGSKPKKEETPEKTSEEQNKTDHSNTDVIKKRILSLTEERNKQEEMRMTDPSDSEKYDAEITRINEEIDKLEKSTK